MAGRNTFILYYSVSPSRSQFRLWNYQINFTMQSIQIGLPLTSSTNTLAGCISSKAMRSDM